MCSIYHFSELCISESKIDMLIRNTLWKYFQGSCQIQATEDISIVEHDPVITHPFRIFIFGP